MQITRARKFQVSATGGGSTLFVKKKEKKKGLKSSQ